MYAPVKLISDLCEYHNASNLEYQKSNLVRIENTHQSPDIIPKLANNLDKILNIKGIIPVESVNRLNQGKLGNFYMRLPQYSEIDESCIPPYHPPSQDPKLLEMAYQNETKYLMSTSTITSIMAHVYY